MHPLDFRDYDARSHMLEELTISTGRQSILGPADDPEIVQLGLVNTTSSRSSASIRSSDVTSGRKRTCRARRRS